MISYELTLNEETSNFLLQRANNLIKFRSVNTQLSQFCSMKSNLIRTTADTSADYCITAVTGDL